jgi:hypothetical protein
VITPDELRELARAAEDVIDYAFDEPYVAMSAQDVLAIADELERLGKLAGNAP